MMVFTEKYQLDQTLSSWMKCCCLTFSISWLFSLRRASSALIFLYTPGNRRISSYTLSQTTMINQDVEILICGETWISRKKLWIEIVLLKVFWHVRNRCEWRNFYFDDVTEKVFEWSKNAYLVLSRWRIFWTSDAWIVFFFLLLLGKNHQILHINWGNTRQKWKLQTPPQFMNRFSCSFVSWNSISPH